MQQIAKVCSPLAKSSPREPSASFEASPSWAAFHMISGSVTMAQFFLLVLYLLPVSGSLKAIKVAATDTPDKARRAQSRLPSISSR